MPSKKQMERRRRKEKRLAAEESLGFDNSVASQNLSVFDQNFSDKNSVTSSVLFLESEKSENVKIITPPKKKAKIFELTQISPILTEQNAENYIDFGNLITLNFNRKIYQEAFIARRAGIQLYSPNNSSKTIVENLWYNPDGWINHEIIYAYLCVIAKNAKQHTVVVDSVFTDPNKKILRNDDRMQRSCYNFDKNIQTDIIILPLFFINHWALVIHDINLGTFFLDSLIKNPSRLDLKNNFDFHPERELFIKNVISKITETENEIIIKDITHNISQQSDSNSCGYFICLFAEAWLFNDGIFNLEPLNILHEKKRILWHINALCVTDEIRFYSRYQNSDIRSQISSIDLNLTLSESPSKCSDLTNSGTNLRGRPKKTRRGSGRPPKTLSCAKKIDKHEVVRKNFDFQQNFKSLDFENDRLHFPFGPNISNSSRSFPIAISREFISLLWENPNEMGSDDITYAFQKYLTTIVNDRRVSVLSPQYTIMDLHFGQNAPNLDVFEYTFNYSPDFDILLINVYFPGHFALIIFDRTDRSKPICIYIDSLPDIDRLYDSSYPNFHPRRLELISNAICSLTPGLSRNDFTIITLNQSEFTRQYDGINCGFFVCLYSEAYLCNNGSLILPNLYINYERRRILWHIAQLTINNIVNHIRREAQTTLENVLPNYTTEATVEGECPRDNNANFICIEPIPDREPDIFISPFLLPSKYSTIRRSSRISSRISEKENSESDSCTENFVKKDTITRRCHFKHIGLPCADVRAKHITTYYDSGLIGDKICQYCNAMLFNSESEIKNGKVSSSHCCHHGNVELPSYSEYPIFFKLLLSAKCSESKEFLSKQNAYNSLLAFASISVGYQESSLDGDICFLLNGEFIRHIGSIHPGKNAPSFLNLYILDPNSALENRTKNVKYGGDRVNPETLKKLDKLIRENHSIAKELTNFHTQYLKTIEENGIDSVKNFRLTLVEAREAPTNVIDSTLHPRQTNLPNEGDTLFSVWTETNSPPFMKGIWITTEEGRVRKLPAFHPKTDSLCYPLLFPNGDDGFYDHIPRKIASRKENISFIDEDIEENDYDSDENIFENDSEISDVSTSQNPNNKRQFVSIRDFIRYRLAIRKDENIHHILSAGGGLSQKFVLDYSARIDADVANFLRRPELNLRCSLPENIIKWFARNAGLNSPEELGSIVLFRRTQPGTRAYFQHKFYDATTIMSRFKKPGYASFFLTFTANPRWPEISRNFIHKGQRTIDRFDLICRVFEDKLRYFHYLIEKKHILGRMIGQESREFQKRYGGPHIHRIYHSDILAIPENIENIIWAHIPPDPDANDKSDWATFIRQVRKLLPKYQMHDCGPHCLNSKGRCKKGFPKPFSNITILYDDKPAIYYRPSPQNSGETLSVKRGKVHVIYDNSRISPYNPYILVRFETHHNIEFAYGQSTNLKYVYKYPFKGPSFSYVKSKENSGKVNVDEPAFFARMLYRSPPEAYSRIMSFRYARLSHVVIALSVHLPGQQKIYMKRSEQKKVAEQISLGALPETPLTAYWKQWSIDPEIKNILFERMPEKYSFNKSTKNWVKRKMSLRPDKIEKRKPIIGRIFPVSPRNPELFALYLLLKHFPGDDTNLKTVNNHVCNTFLEAARLRGLVDNNDVWIQTLEEGSASLMPGQMRQLFANILIFGSTEKCIVDGALLWEKFINHFYDIRCTDAERPQRIDRALALIEKLLIKQGKQCKDYGLPTPNISLINDPDRGLDEFFFPKNLNDDDIDVTVDTSCYENGKLNSKQQQFYSLIKNVFTDSSKQKLFHLTGDGGSGKTYLLNYILYQMRRAGKKVIATASTGMASTRFYSGATTVHSAFKFGIEIEPGKLPSIPFDSFFGRRIIEAEIIIIDEMTMLDKVLFENVDALCRLMCSRHKDLPFGGKCVIISGDWKQSLPVVIDSSGTTAQVATCIQSSHLYNLFTKFKLTESMRINPNELLFLSWLDDIGNGVNGNAVSIPSSMLVHSREELIDWVFDKGFDMPSNQLLRRLLLATTNRIVDLNNSIILEKFKQDYVDYFSVDAPLEENPLAVNAADFDVSQLNLLNPLGMPHHHLRLKIGSIIVLLINLNTSKGLCNGTRLIVKKLTPNLIEAEAITGGSSRSGLILGIPRYQSTFKDKRPGGVSFSRFQFPVRIAFTMTVVKAQGQTCDRLGIDFTEEPFSHGQLYTALSRVTSSDGIKIYAPNKSLDEDGNPKIRNIVATGLQFD